MPTRRSGSPRHVPTASRSGPAYGTGDTSTTKPSRTSTRRSSSIPWTPTVTPSGATVGPGSTRTRKPWSTSMRRSVETRRVSRPSLPEPDSSSRHIDSMRPCRMPKRRCASHRFSDGFLVRAGVWELRKEFDKALADANQAIKLDPRNAEAFVLRGDASYNRGDRDKALGLRRGDPPFSRSHGGQDLDQEGGGLRVSRRCLESAGGLRCGGPARSQERHRARGPRRGVSSGEGTTCWPSST